MFTNIQKTHQNILNEILKVSAIGGSGADLSLIKEAPGSGIMLMSKKLVKLTELKLINQSVTGVYESYVDLLTV